MPAPLAFALPDVTEAEINAVVECMRTGWLTTGLVSSQFESEFAAYVGGGVHAVAVNSWTAGAFLVLYNLGIGPGDEVITSCNTFSATAKIILDVGAQPVLVDVDPVTLNIDVDKIEAAITSRTKAIIPVHFGGLACDMDRIWEIARRHNLRVIEDAAHGLPATWRGRMIGNGESDAVVYSFYATKTITTAEGGMIVTRDPNLAKTCRLGRLHGINRDAAHRALTSSLWAYDVVQSGFKCNMPDVLAAIGLAQLRRSDEMTARRTEIAHIYRAAFADMPLELPVLPPEGDVHSWHLFVMRMTDDAIGRDDFIQQMKIKHNVSCSVHFIPLHHHTFWKANLKQPLDFPVADRELARTVSLPIYSKMTDADIDRVIDSVRETILSAKPYEFTARPRLNATV